MSAGLADWALSRFGTNAPDEVYAAIIDAFRQQYIANTLQIRKIRQAQEEAKRQELARKDAAKREIQRQEAKRVKALPERAYLIERLGIGAIPWIDLALRDGEGGYTLPERQYTPDELSPTEAVCQRVETREVIQLAIKLLDARGRAVVTLKYGLSDDKCRTYAEVAKELQISEPTVWRIHRRALENLKQWLA